MIVFVYVVHFNKFAIYSSEIKAKQTLIFVVHSISVRFLYVISLFFAEVTNNFMFNV